MCELYDKNENLVPYVYKTYFKGYRRFYDDLMQEGYLELWRVANNFDESRGSNFASYAIKCIKGKMSWFININRGIIKPPESLIKLCIKVLNKYKSMDNVPLDINEIAEEFGVSCDVAYGLNMFREGVISLDSVVKDSENESTIGDLYCKDDEDIELEVEKKVILEQFLEGVENKRNAYIMKRVLNGDSYTDISKDVGISYRQVSRIASKMVEDYLVFQEA